MDPTIPGSHAKVPVFAGKGCNLPIDESLSTRTSQARFVPRFYLLCHALDAEYALRGGMHTVLIPESSKHTPIVLCCRSYMLLAWSLDELDESPVRPARIGF